MTLTDTIKGKGEGKPIIFDFVVCTAKTEAQREELPLIRSLEKMALEGNWEVRVNVEFENKAGLTVIYNMALDSIQDSDYMIFTHDDIALNDAYFFDKIIASQFDLTGPVGGKAWAIPGGFDLAHRPLIWTVATCGRGASGFMLHDLHDGGMMPSSYGIAPARTATLDGSMIIFGRRAMDSGLRWDEQFNFHWYDMDICAQASKQGLTVGTAPILLTHGSVGGSVSQPEFLAGQKRFLDKWTAC